MRGEYPFPRQCRPAPVELRPKVQKAPGGAGRKPGTCQDALLAPSGAAARVVGKYLEQTCWYPKDGELCLARMKPGEILVEVRSNSDVQIDCQSWV